MTDNQTSTQTGAKTTVAQAEVDAAVIGAAAPLPKVTHELVPYSDADEPRAERAQTECWFARWAVEHLPNEVQVVNSHSNVVTPVARLASYLESDLCKS